MLNLLALLLFGLAQSSPVPALDPSLDQMVAPVSAAIAAERRVQASMPPPADDAERLRRMGRLDQVARAAIPNQALAGLSDADRQAAVTRIWAVIGEVDQEHRAALVAMTPPEGWFRSSRYGPEAATSAFLILQHGNPEMWKRYLPALEALVAEGEVNGQMYAMLYDRLAVSEGRPQRYGTQIICVEGRWSAGQVEDRETIDERRASVGIPVSFARYEARYAARPNCA